MLEINDVLNKKTNIILKGINNKFWALDVESGAQFKLNELSYDILSAIDGEVSLAVIIENQLKKYNVERTILEKDVLNFVSSAIEKGLIFK